MTVSCGEGKVLPFCDQVSVSVKLGLRTVIVTRTSQCFSAPLGEMDGWSGLDLGISLPPHQLSAD